MLQQLQVLDKSLTFDGVLLQFSGLQAYTSHCLSPSWRRGSQAQRSGLLKTQVSDLGLPHSAGKGHVLQTCSSRSSDCTAGHEEWSRPEDGRRSQRENSRLGQILFSETLHGVFLVLERDTASCKASPTQEEAGGKWDVSSLKCMCQKSLWPWLVPLLSGIEFGC